MQALVSVAKSPVQSRGGESFLTRTAKEDDASAAFQIVPSNRGGESESRELPCLSLVAQIVRLVRPEIEPASKEGGERRARPVIYTNPKKRHRRVTRDSKADFASGESSE